MTMTLHGIPNCDTVRLARRWLAARDIDAAFHDWRRDGVPATLLDDAANALGWQALLNRSGTTWRRLSDDDRAAAADAAGALALMRREPALIRRPLVRWADGSWTIGFDEADWTRRTRSPG